MTKRLLQANRSNRFDSAQAVASRMSKQAANPDLDEDIEEDEDLRLSPQNVACIPGTARTHCWRQEIINSYLAQLPERRAS